MFLPCQDAETSPFLSMESFLTREVQQVDMTNFLRDGDASSECSRVADSLQTFGAVVLRDPRVNASDADTFLNMMERYFAQSREEKLKDARPHLFYQVRLCIVLPDFPPV